MKMTISNYVNLFSKKKHSLCLFLFAFLLLSCNDEKVVDDPEIGPERGKTAITIEGDVIDPPEDSRSTDPIVYFTGGNATGAGLYNGDVAPIVAAHPNDGYEVDFFYGGPETASSKQYDYANSGSTSFTVPLKGVNHYFKCGFKKKSAPNYLFTGGSGSIYCKGQKYSVGNDFWHAITYGNGKFVTVGYGGYITSSTDGIHWETRHKVTSKNWASVKYVNNMFFAVGAGNMAKSTDGSSWTSINTYPYNDIQFYDVEYGNGKYLVVGKSYDGSYAFVGESSDGITWKEIDNGISVSMLVSVAFGSGKFVAAGSTGYVSTDGNFSQLDSKNVATQDVVYGNGKFILVGNRISYSADGQNWTLANIPNSGSKIWHSVTYRNGVFAAMSTDGYTTNSTDGIKWTTAEQTKDSSGNIISGITDICIHSMK